MKKSKISGKKARFPSPFDITIHKNEWTCAAKLGEWINDITKEKDIPFGKASRRRVISLLPVILSNLPHIDYGRISILYCVSPFCRKNFLTKWIASSIV